MLPIAPCFPKCVPWTSYFRITGVGVEEEEEGRIYFLFLFFTCSFLDPVPPTLLNQTEEEGLQKAAFLVSDPHDSDIWGSLKTSTRMAFRLPKFFLLQDSEGQRPAPSPNTQCPAQNLGQTLTEITEALQPYTFCSRAGSGVSHRENRCRAVICTGARQAWWG